MCNMVGMLPYDVAGGDAHFHCNLTWRTGVSGGATPALESAQWAVQSTRKAMDESKDRLSLDLLLKLVAQGQQGARY